MKYKDASYPFTTQSSKVSKCLIARSDIGTFLFFLYPSGKIAPCVEVRVISGFLIKSG